MLNATRRNFSVQEFVVRPSLYQSTSTQTVTCYQVTELLSLLIIYSSQLMLLSLQARLLLIFEHHKVDMSDL